MSKNLKNQNTSNCIVVSKGGSLKELHVPESEMNRAKYAALCKTPPTYESAFKRHTTWNIKKYGIIIELWGRANGRAGQENKYEFPPPVDEILFFGDCVLVSTTPSTHAPFTCSAWKKAHAQLFGGFDDLEKLADEDDAEHDELEHVPNKKKTKHGYLKDGFIIDDAPRTKRPVCLKMAIGAHALLSDDIVDCKGVCDKSISISELVRHKRNIKDAGNTRDEDEECEDNDDNDDNEDECDEEDAADANETDDDDNDDDNDDDDDTDNDDDGESDADDDDDADADADADDADDANDDEAQTNVSQMRDATHHVYRGGSGIKVKPITTASENVAPATKSNNINTIQTTSSQAIATTSNKKRVGRVGGGNGRAATTVKRDELIKSEHARDGGSASGSKSANHVDDKRIKPANLDSELEEEPYL